MKSLNLSAMRCVVFGAAATSLLALGAPALAQSADNSPGSCSAPSDWFASGIPDPDIHAKDATKFASLCDFHTWSWNAFLWLMEEKDGVPRFETMPTLAQVLDGSYDADAPAPAMAMLKLREAKDDHPIDAIAQAATPGILVDQNGRAVYYSQYVNPQMYTQIHDANWFTAAGLAAESPDAQFDVGNIELKAAWKVVGENETADYAYTRQALIPPVAELDQNGVKVIGIAANLTEADYLEETVALVGFHVVGWVTGHSEAIWASFSPPGIAPIVPDDHTNGPVSLTGTPFYTAKTALPDCNQTAVPIQKLVDGSQTFAVLTQVCQIYAGGTLPVDKTLANGEPQPNANRVVLDQLNASVQSQLPAGSLAGKYIEVGAVWSISDFTAWCNSLPEADQPPDCKASKDRPTTVTSNAQVFAGKGNSTFQKELKGSDVLSNPVIETFTQTTVGEDNCFGCHNSIQYQPADPDIPALQASMLNLSHIILEAYVRDPSFNN